MTESIQAQNIGIQPAIMSETALEVAKALHAQKTFVDSNYVQTELENTRTEIKIHVDVLREGIEKNETLYKTSMDAAREFIGNESNKLRMALTEENKKIHDDEMKKLTEKMLEMQKKLESQNERHFEQFQKKVELQLQNFVNEMQNQSKTELDKMKTMLEKHKRVSEKVIQQEQKEAKKNNTGMQREPP
ncbi:unnamed protein product, partial [Rotaria sp. Silwood2]